MSDAQAPQKLKPKGDRILVRPIDPEETTAGGITIPEAHRKPQNGVRRGAVVAVGDGARNKHGVRVPILGVKEGDTIQWNKSYPGIPVEMRGEQFVLVGVDIIVGVEES